jgi:hypothetical protein
LVAALFGSAYDPAPEVHDATAPSVVTDLYSY